MPRMGKALDSISSTGKQLDLTFYVKIGNIPHVTGENETPYKCQIRMDTFSHPMGSLLK